MATLLHRLGMTRLPQVALLPHCLAGRADRGRLGGRCVRQAHERRVLHPRCPVGEGRRPPVRAFPGATDAFDQASVKVVVAAPKGKQLADPQNRAAVDDQVADLAQLPQCPPTVASAPSPGTSTSRAWPTWSRPRSRRSTTRWPRRAPGASRSRPTLRHHQPTRARREVRAARRRSRRPRGPHAASFSPRPAEVESLRRPRTQGPPRRARAASCSTTACAGTGSSAVVRWPWCCWWSWPWARSPSRSWTSAWPSPRTAPPHRRPRSARPPTSAPKRSARVGTHRCWSSSTAASSEPRRSATRRTATSSTGQPA